MKALLTDVSVRALPPAPKQTKVWDTKTKGFGVLVSGSTKSFFVSYGRQRNIKTLGRYPDTTLAEARKKALAVLGADHQPLASTVKFADAVTEFIEDNYRDSKGRTKPNTKRLLERHFVPTLGAKVVATITDQDISNILATLSKTPSEQLHAFRAVRTMLRWCARPPRRYCTRSPLEGYAAPGTDKKGKRILSDAELVKIWLACEDFFGSLVRLLILWGTRNGETARVCRTWVEEGILTIPGEFTKNSRAHAIPLLPMARSILAEQKTNSDYFFPGKDGEGHFKDGSWGKLKKELEKRSGVTGWQLRDIRRTFRSNMAKLKVSREICEILLNHVTGADKNDLDEIYDRYDYLDEKRAALRKWEARIRQLLAGPK
jgi:Arm DNA-binding domain